MSKFNAPGICSSDPVDHSMNSYQLYGDRKMFSKQSLKCNKKNVGRAQKLAIDITRSSVLWCAYHRHHASSTACTDKNNCSSLSSTLAVVVVKRSLVVVVWLLLCPQILPRASAPFSFILLLFLVSDCISPGRDLCRAKHLQKVRELCSELRLPHHQPH